MTQSMSRVSRCIDNSPTEGFWVIIKCEMYYLGNFKDYDRLSMAIESYIPFTASYLKMLHKKLSSVIDGAQLNVFVYFTCLLDREQFIISIIGLSRVTQNRHYLGCYYIIH